MQTIREDVKDLEDRFNKHNIDIWEFQKKVTEYMEHRL